MHRLTLVMTHQCNFDCRYCPQTHEEVYMPVETAKKALDLLRAEILTVVHPAESPEQQRVQVSFYGGEPLLARKTIEQIVAYANETIGGLPEVSICYEITTNGLLLDQNFLDFARKNKILLALSHDGEAQDLTRVDRGGNKTRSRIDEKLKMLLSTFPETVVMMTVHPDHTDTFSESIRFFHEAGVKSVSFVPAHGERVSWTDENFSVFTRELEKAKDLYVQWNQGKELFRLVPFENKIRNYIHQRSADNRMCHFSCGKTMVDVDGRYYPCSHFIGREGFCTGSVEEGKNTSVIESLEAKRVEPGTCRDCALRARCRHTCACANHGHTGDMSSVSALQCEYEKLIIRLADEAAAELIKETNKRFVGRMYKD